LFYIQKDGVYLHFMECIYIQRYLLFNALNTCCLNPKLYTMGKCHVQTLLYCVWRRSDSSTASTYVYTWRNNVLARTVLSSWGR